ncbi:hypothetical protein ACF0H5_015230 [Mactra antiquata]
MATEEREWTGGDRSGLLEDENGVIFTIPNSEVAHKEHKIPKRLQQYNKKPTVTAEQIAEKQKQAEQRKKKHDEHRARQARLISEEIMKYDQSMQSQLQRIKNAESNEGGSSEGQWYKNCLPGKPS